MKIRKLYKSFCWCQKDGQNISRPMRSPFTTRPKTSGSHFLAKSMTFPLWSTTILVNARISFDGLHNNNSPSRIFFTGNILLKPLIDSAGQDISHWFDPKTKDIKKMVDPFSGCLVYYTPHGRFQHIPPSAPTTDWANDFGKPWWRDEKYCIGVLSKKTRFIKIINSLTLQHQIIEVSI